ncbi:MAG: ATP-binding protein [Pseudomonadota bacterium]|nr:ATP-binding protein [Pseudomonadota bacterium]
MSLRLRAVLIAGISLIVLWVMAAAWMMRDAHAHLDRTLDGRLAMSARMVAGLLERGSLQPRSSPADFSEAVQVRGGEGIACEIRSLRGEVLARTTGSPGAGFDSLPPGYSLYEEQGRHWRVYVLQAGEYQITTADRIDQRNILIADLLRAAGVPFLVAVLGSLIALWVGIGRGLAPLKVLRRELREKTADDTSPIAQDHAPAELRPVLEAMNGLFGRLAQALASQRAFTDAAAHELRTPLTVIDTHLQVARMTDGEEAELSLDSAEAGVKRLRHTLDQMMALAWTEAAVHEEDVCHSVVAAVESALAAYSGDIRQRVSWVVDGTDTGTAVPKSMLETAVRNLVDNALRYSPDNETVDVTLLFGEAHCLITVADRGPGLSVEQTAQIGKRFWRGDQGRRAQDGAGLGISIVRAIAKRFSGELTLLPRDGGGLGAELRIPAEDRS